MKRILLSIAMIAALCSCDHREINIYTDTKVVFDWSNLNQDDTKSSAMEVHYYNKETGEHIVVMGDEREAEKFIPYATYDVIAVSSQVENVEYKGMDSYDTAQAYATISSDGKLLQPGSIYSAHQQMTLKPSDKTVHTLSVDPYIKKVALNIDLSGETARIANCKISLSGIAVGVNLTTGKVIYSSTESYSIESEQINSLPLETVLSFFGTDDNANVLTIDVTLNDGTVTTVTADITEALDKINDPNFPGIEIKPEVEITKDPITGVKATLIGWKVGTGSGTVGGK